MKLDALLSAAAAAHTGIIGANASGKRTLLRELESTAVALRRSVHVVDFNAHRRLATAERDSTVARVLGGLENADVVVRFGLTPIWWRTVGSLSTGEIRKVILARAVCADPDVLLLDRPFDGLDHKSRDTLLRLLDDLTSGKSAARPLVQGVRWKQRKPVQLFVVSHRHEFPRAVTRLLRCERPGEPPVEMKRADLAGALAAERAKRALVDQSAPVDIHSIWGAAPEGPADHSPVIHVSNLTVFPVAVPDKLGRQSKGPILNRVSWTVLPREVWWLAGDNGASKSALLNCAVSAAALLELASMQHRNRAWEVETDPDADRRRKRPPVVTCRGRVSFVSTEMHLAVLDGDANPTLAELIGAPADVCDKLVALVGLDASTLPRLFRSLSLGEQKLGLIARALAYKPRLLVLDEALQALDAAHRERIGRVVTSIATSPGHDVAVVFVSHHVDELPRVVSHRLLMVGGTVASRGPWHR